MKSSREKWEEIGEKLLRQTGIREHQKVVDFGCGSGNYTFPAARIVGENGSVYALDKDKKVLNELMHKAESTGMYNIFRLDVPKDSDIPLDNESIDVKTRQEQPAVVDSNNHRMKEKKDPRIKYVDQQK